MTCRRTLHLSRNYHNLVSCTFQYQLIEKYSKNLEFLYFSLFKFLTPLASIHITVRTSPERNMDASNTKKYLKWIANILTLALSWEDCLQLVSLTKWCRCAVEIHQQYSWTSQKTGWVSPSFYAFCSEW